MTFLDPGVVKVVNGLVVVNGFNVVFFVVATAGNTQDGHYARSRINILLQ